MKLKVGLARIKKQILMSAYAATDSVLKTDKYWRYYMQQNGYHNPDYFFEKHQMAFIHMPKTGGTSFSRMLGANPDNLFANLKIHKPISANCSVNEYKYITILRDPVDRVWSYYQMVLRNPKGYPYREYAINGLDSFLSNCWAANDMGCQYYSGKVYEKVDDNIYQMAAENLNHFEEVLYFDDFGKEIKWFFNKHGIEVKEVLHERKASYEKPSPQERKLIQKYNQYDLKLYHQWIAKKNKHART